LEDVTKIVQTIQFGRYKEKDQYTVDRLHESNLLYQKAYLHGLSILKLSKGIHVSLPEYKINTVFNDPISIGIIVRGLLKYTGRLHVTRAPYYNKKGLIMLA
jgi:hypothetical protein